MKNKEVHVIPVINSQGALRFMKVKTARAEVSRRRERRKKGILIVEKHEFWSFYRKDCWCCMNGRKKRWWQLQKPKEPSLQKQLWGHSIYATGLSASPSRFQEEAGQIKRSSPPAMEAAPSCGCQRVLGTSWETYRVNVTRRIPIWSWIELGHAESHVYMIQLMTPYFGCFTDQPA